MPCSLPLHPAAPWQGVADSASCLEKELDHLSDLFPPGHLMGELVRAAYCKAIKQANDP